MIWSAVILGLASSLHCVGMCGAIALMLPLDHTNPTRKTLQLLSYHAGRIFIYAVLGFIFGLFGRGLYLAGMQQRLSVLIGLSIVLLALFPERYWAWALGRASWIRIVLQVRQSLGRRLKQKSLRSIFVLGIFNGLLPCALVYMALFGAVAMQNPSEGAAYMALFGVGTVPLMSMVVYLQNLLAPILRKKWRLIIPLAAIVIGSLFIIRGLGLGIPYVSPQKVQLTVMRMPDCR